MKKIYDFLKSETLGTMINTIKNEYPLWDKEIIHVKETSVGVAITVNIIEGLVKK